jgi:uncharacterized protein
MTVIFVWVVGLSLKLKKKKQEKGVDILIVIYLLALGAVAGFAAGLLGIGGGILLVPFLTILFAWQGMPSNMIIHAAIATSMACILLTSISSVWAHHQRGTVKWPIVMAMAPGVIIGGLVAGGAVFAVLHTAWLSLFFALSVAYSGWHMLRNKKPKPSRQMPGPIGNTAVGAGIGFFSGLVGAGGGIMFVPFMVWCNVALPNAISTSAALSLPVALANTVGYVVSGLNESISRPGMVGFIYWPALLIVCTSVLTAPLGARMSQLLPLRTLQRVFAIFLLVLAVYMLAKAW